MVSADEIDQATTQRLPAGGETVDKAASSGPGTEKTEETLQYVGLTGDQDPFILRFCRTKRIEGSTGIYLGSSFVSRSPLRSNICCAWIGLYRAIRPATRNGKYSNCHPPNRIILLVDTVRNSSGAEYNAGRGAIGSVRSLYRLTPARTPYRLKIMRIDGCKYGFIQLPKAIHPV